MKLRDIISPFYAWKRALEKPFTIAKPVAERPGAPRYRGFHVNDTSTCIGCGTCEEICQNGAIDMVEVPGFEAGKGDSGLRPAIDYGRCCWCSLCVDICPTGCLGMSNEYNWISDAGDDWVFVPGVDDKRWNRDELGYRRAEAAWLLEPEAVEMPVIEPEKRKKTFEEMTLGYDQELAKQESERCIECGLCIEACPTHMDVPQYIRAIREDDLDEALRILYDTNPFSESCGRICTAHCQEACALAHKGEPIMIRWLKRYITDRTADSRDEILGIGSDIKETGKSIAIVGGGPSGLTAAYYLKNYGHAVTLYEMHDKLGGMLLWGIPEYRLPEKILQREIKTILDMGVEVKLTTSIGGDLKLSELRRKHDAVYISIGAQKGSGMPIDGMDAPGVLIGVEFLERINEGERPDLGRRVTVVGGGNTAMDVCRSAVRLGSEDVRVLYRRTEKEMPAAHEEVEEAREEGVEFDFLVAPEKIERGSEGLEITCIRMELGEPDESGRRRPVPIEGSEFTVTADTCIMAIGQYVDASAMEEAGVKVTRWQTAEVDEETLSTSVEGIFAGGDCMTGPDDAIRAIADGKKAAYAIHRYLEKGSGE
jgi:glutamate synthase (NADPH/NADH) small chain